MSKDNKNVRKVRRLLHLHEYLCKCGWGGDRSELETIIINPQAAKRGLVTDSDVILVCPNCNKPIEAKKSNKK
jgi:predicted RNA-binding Zn-ribbon protein involved in translation (DUF1610 family)